MTFVKTSAALAAVGALVAAPALAGGYAEPVVEAPVAAPETW